MSTIRRYLTAAGVSLLGLCAVASAVGAAPAPKPAWKLLAATGPTNLPPRQSEVQRVTVEAGGGTFTLAEITEGEGTLAHAAALVSLTEGSNQATVLLPQEGPFVTGMTVSGAGIPAETMVTAVNGAILELSHSATVTSPFAAISGSSKEVTDVSVPLGEFHPGDLIAGTGIPAGTTIASVGSGTLVLSQYPTKGGAVALISTELTAPIAYDATAAEVQGALEGLPAIPPGAATVGGGPGGDIEHPWSVDFAGRESHGPYALKDVPQLVADGVSLIGEHANARVTTVVPGGNGTGEIAVYPSNVGALATSGTVTVRVGPLPPGVVTSGQATSGTGGGWVCPGGAGEDTVTCTSTVSIPPTQLASPVDVPVEVEPTVATTASVPVTVSGGGAGEATVQTPIVVSRTPAKPGIQAFWAGAFEADGTPSTQAGAHPASAITDFELNTVRSTSGQIVPAGDPKKVNVDLPPGFIGDPLVTERCAQDILVAIPPAEEGPICGRQDVIGKFFPLSSGIFGEQPQNHPIYNDVPAEGSAAEFSSFLGALPVSLLGSVRSSEDFGVSVAAPHIPTLYKVYGSLVSLEGMPAAAHGRAFLTNPTDCSVQREEREQGRGPATRIDASTWQEPTEFAHAEDPLPLLTGCRPLTEAWLGNGPDPAHEKPSFEFRPTTTRASSPTGATARLHIPQAGLTDPNRLATSDLKKTVATLPKGLAVNPSSANGLEACSEAQVGYKGSGFPSPNPIRFDEAPVSCPDGSKLGTFTIKTPLLEEPVGGTIYLAAQEDNPFHSLIALYLVVENKRFGLTLKLAGEVRPDPRTGQLTATFDNNPQLPFEDLILHFRGGGGRSTLATPETCGHFETTGSLEPWSAEHREALAIHERGFSVTDSCASSESNRPFSPSFDAGTTGTRAGAYSPLVIKVNRRDGEQELRSLDFTLPLGLTGKLAGIPYCPESAIHEAEGKSGRAERASASCPAASRIGTVDTAAGVGSEPIHVGGSVYLAGPYKGAPLSTVVVTPAVAGPFDLGDVVVRAPLFVDLETAQITAKSDPIPTILRGIRLKVRSVAIYLDRHDFTLNPTDCEPMPFSASLHGSDGAHASPSIHFQVGGCGKLKFRPRLKLSLKGATRRTGHPALKAVVTYPAYSHTRCAAKGKRAKRLSRKAKQERRRAKRLHGAAARRVRKGARHDARMARRLRQGAKHCLREGPPPEANIARAQVGLPHSEFLDQGNLNKVCKQADLKAGTCPRSSVYGHAKAWTPLLEKPLQGPVYLGVGYGYKLPALVADLNGQIRILLVGRVDTTKRHGIRNTFEVVPDAPVSRFVLTMKGGKKYGLLENSENVCKKTQRASALFNAQNGLRLHLRPKIQNDCKHGKRRKRAKKPSAHTRSPKQGQGAHRRQGRAR